MLPQIRTRVCITTDLGSCKICLKSGHQNFHFIRDKVIERIGELAFHLHILTPNNDFKRNFIWEARGGVVRDDVRYCLKIRDGFQ